MLVRSKSYIGELEELPQRKIRNLETIHHWLAHPEPLTSNNILKRQIVAAAVHLTRLDEQQIAGTVNCLDGAISERKEPNYFEHKSLPFMWCDCNKLLPVFRFLTILWQVNAIFENFPPDTEIVHTAFSEGGLLQTYCLIYTLVNSGYKKIHVNVIGHYIVEMVDGLHRHIDLEKEGKGFYPGIICLDEEILVIKDVIKADFLNIGLAHGATVMVDIYKSAYDYIEAVERHEAKRSNSFDNIDPSELESKIYTATKTTARLEESRCEGLALTNYDDLRQIGNISDYSCIKICAMRAHSKKEGEHGPIKKFKIVTGAQEYQGAASLLRSNEDKITMQNALMLMRDSSEIDQILKKNWHPYFLLVGEEDPSRIFKELVNRTSVAEKPPVVFESHLNQIYRCVER